MVTGVSVYMFSIALFMILVKLIILINLIKLTTTTYYLLDICKFKYTHLHYPIYIYPYKDTAYYT